MSKISDYAKAVKAIKTAILQSRYCAARMANAEQLKLYFISVAMSPLIPETGIGEREPLMKFPANTSRIARSARFFAG